MTWSDMAFLAARLLTAAFCAYAALVAVRRAEQNRDRPDRRQNSLMGAALLTLLALLAVANAIEEGVFRAGFPIPTLDWSRLVVDTLSPAFFLMMLRVMGERDALERALATAAEHDPLTGLLNRAGFEQRATAALSGAKRHNEPSVAVMLDIDFFKRVNDGWGHPAGDAVLRGVATVARTGLRVQDVLGRYGGEEFALVLPGVTPDQALPLVERLRQAIAAEVAHPGAPQYRLTLSGGIAAISGSDVIALEDALDAADTALYAAKQAGRDRAMIST